MDRRGRSFELLTIHSLTWLFVANAVGVLLATLLLFPRLGDLLGPLTYGRWMPLHLDLQLYGWCSLPLVGLLFRMYLPRSVPGRMARTAVSLWSGSLLFGAVSWLAGRSSGKLFLEWSGAARALLAVSLGFLGLTLASGFLRQLARRGAARWALASKGALLLALLAVPFVLYWAASPEMYPPVNPDSGGATGGSLLGSTLGIVALFLVCPFLLGMRPTDGGRAAAEGAAVLAAHFAWFALLDHGDRSHHEIVQLLSLASLVIWLPLLIRHLRRFRWPAVSRPWLAALGGWAFVLLATGLVAFLPGVLEHWKFTNALVAHAHVAMAGLVTSLNVLILIALNKHTAHRDLFAGRGLWLLWQTGCLVLVASLLVLGIVEAASPGIMFRSGTTVFGLYVVRWIGGWMMAIASGRWLAAAASMSCAS